MPDGLTLKQATFAAEYVAKKGNGSQAAIAAGYSPKGAHVAAHRLLRKATVKKRIERLTRRHDVTADRVLTRLDNLSMQAEAEGLLAVSVKAEELLGRALGLFVDRSVNVNANIDLTAQHIEAIRQLGTRGARRPQNKSERAGDDALEVQATAAVGADKSTFHNVGYAISDPDNRDKSVIDQRTTSDVLTPSTLKQSSDVDE